MIGATSRNLQTQKTEPLSREEEYDLILRGKAGGERALKRLIHKNLGLIKKEANRQKYQVDWNVLVAAGENAIAKAVEGFDLSSGNRFSTYAVPVIHSEIRDCVCRETGIGRTTMDNLAKISRASTDLNFELGRNPTLKEISKRSELSRKQIFTAWEKNRFAQTYSLNQTFGDNSCEWLDCQVDEEIDVWRTAEDVEVLDVLGQLETDGYLEHRQIQVLIAKVQGYSNKEAGRELGVSGERVRQLVKSARETIQAFAAGTLKPLKKIASISTPCNLPVSQEAAEPVVKRVDASRLGGRIGRVVKQIFSQTKVQTTYSNSNGGRNLDDQIFAKQIQSIQQLTSGRTSSDSRCSIGWAGNCDHQTRQDQPRFSTPIASQSMGRITDATKHLLVFCRGRSDGLTDRSGCQSASKDQRCRGLGQARKAWRGCLEVGQVISARAIQPFVSAYQCVKGFASNLNQWRTNLQLSTANVFDLFGIEQGGNLPRPPTDHKDKFLIETNSFLFEGILMSFTKFLALACLFMLGLFLAPKLFRRQNPFIFLVFSQNVDTQEYLAMRESLKTYVTDLESEHARDGPS
ncbi:MAG: sigma-70 family RNA polymerase sigma factor [Acaryochloris sp. SU_5_25]|nr:sigma-70 family RNA polymerase sigma factor [Acaryochloris sp. SU_5_25]